MYKKALILKDEYIQKYSSTPVLSTFAGGRVVLMGDHLDYSNYGVITFAINRTLNMAVGFGPLDKPMLTLKNVKSDIYPDLTYHTHNDFAISKHNVWGDYIIASVLAFCEYQISLKELKTIGKTYSKIKNNSNCIDLLTKLFDPPIQFLVDGDILVASGLSSSSTLVVTSMLALFQLKGINITRHELAELCALAEHHIGTAGGGMDQATMSFATPQSALYIQMNPILPSSVKILSNLAFVLANSNEISKKSPQIDYRFNQLVFSIKIAVLMLTKKLIPSQILQPQNISEYTAISLQKQLNISHEEMLNLVEIEMNNEFYTLKQIIEEIGEENLEAVLQITGKGVLNNTHLFNLKGRLKHVYSESKRVNDYVNICNDEIMCEKEKIKLLGKLTKESFHSACVYGEFSSTQLINLNSYAMKCGSLGGKIIGAGKYTL